MTFERYHINSSYPRSLDKLSRDYVLYIVRKSDEKVIQVSVVTRAAMSDWWLKMTTKYPKDDYAFVLASISVIGEMYELDLENEKTGVKVNPAPPSSESVN